MARGDSPGDIRPLGPADAAAAHALFEMVWRDTPAGFLTHRPRAEFEALTGPASASVGCFSGSRLLAYSMARIVPAGGDCLARGAQLLARPDEDTGALQGTVVHPEARGRGLHRRLLAARRDLLIARGVTQQMGAVFLGNLSSLETNLKFGLLARGLVEDADGMNFLVYVDTTENGPRPDRGRAEWIFAADVPRQQAALENGHRGWALRRDGDAGSILFAPPVPGAR